MPTETQRCPQREELVSYLLGKLPPEDSNICEAHIAQCDPCEQTIRSIDISDTLNDLAVNGLRNSSKPIDQESAVIGELIDEIQNWSDPDSLKTKTSNSLDNSSSDLEDRAAEVQHFFDPAPDSESIGIVGKYRIVELLGAGSSGVVYRAIDTQLGRNVAVKFLRPSLGSAARQRFLTEAQAAAVINHPNVVQIYEVGMEDRLAFIAMQCLPGQTLEQRLTEQNALGNDETRKIGKQIAAGIAAAHQSGIVHRDIKPANIWICSTTDNVTILDFGLARILDEDPQLTCTGLIAGTPCFMSPEQTRGRDIDRRSDFFSLGCLLYQCSTGVLPFRSENVLATLQSVQMLTPPTPRELDPGVDPELSTLVMTLLEKSPLNRPDQAEDIAAAFETPVADWKFDPAKIRQPSKPFQPAPIKSTVKNKEAIASTGGWWPSIVSLAALGLLLAGSFFMPQIIRIATNQGQIVIESNDPDVQVEVLKGGERIEIVDLKTKQKLNIVAGEYQLRPIGDSNEISIDKQTVTISRGKEEIVRVTRNQNLNKFADPVVGAAARAGSRDHLMRMVNQLRGADGQNSDSATAFSSFEPSVEELARQSPKPSIERILLNNVLAEQIAESVQEIYDDNYADTQGAAVIKPLRSPNSLCVVGTPQAIASVQAIVSKLDDDAPPTKTEEGPFATWASPAVKTSDILDGMFGHGPEQPKVKPKNEFYLLDSGDILGVYVDGVLGDLDKAPPVMMPPPGSGLAPAIGFPIAVREDGTISIPLIEDLMVRGKSTKEVQNELVKAFTTGDDPILRPPVRIMVSLVRQRGYVPPATIQLAPKSDQDSLAMSTAQLEAAETEFGKDHPVTKKLRQNFDALLKASKSASPTNASDLSNRHAASNGSPEPTFNRTTYAEAYNIAKYERNPELAWLAIRGMLELHDDNTKEQTIQTCIEFFRRTPTPRNYDPRSRASKAMKRMAMLLDAETLESMLMSEVKNGNLHSQAILIDVVCNYLASQKKKKKIFESHKKENAVTIIESAKDQKLDPHHAAELLYYFDELTDLDVSKFEGLESLLVAALSESELSRPYEHIIKFAMQSSDNSPEIVKAVYGLIDRASHDESFTKFVYQKLTALSPDQLKVIVPMIPNQHQYKSFKAREARLNSIDTKGMLELIAACGEHAQTLKEDFEQFEESNFEKYSDIREAYLKARKAVLGR